MPLKPEAWLDRYSLQARLAPAIIALIPPGALLGIWANACSLSVISSALLAIALTYGLATLLAQLTRDLGKSKEASLYQRWGGKPSTVLLRHRSKALNSYTLARYHKKLGELVRDVRLPSAEEEQLDPEGADAVYEACGDYLRATTQDLSKYRRLFEENIGFGLRRNLWALKPTALILDALCILVGVVHIYYAETPGQMLSPAWLAVLSLNSILLLCWLFIIRPHWVRLPADGYARQLIACCEDFDSVMTASRIVLPD
ncbi:MAG: hypothetical protein ACRD22_01980 [Terriglobia bacterium]